MFVTIMTITRITENMVMIGIILNGVITSVGFILCTKEIIDRVFCD